MRYFLRIFSALVIGLTLAFGALAAFYGPSLNIDPPGRNSLSFEQLLDRQGDYLEFNRGVLLQSFANFRDANGSIIAPSKVSIRVQGTAACLKIADDPCAKFTIPLSELRALLSFVKAKRFLAFTLPSDGPDPEKIINKIRDFGMKKVGDKYIKSDWVAEELAIPELVEAFRYIDFDDPYDFSNRFFERAVAEKYRNEVNAKIQGKEPPSFFKTDDASWFNSDLHANFLALANDGSVVCKGLPARYRWLLAEGQRFAFLRAIEFAAPEIQNKHHEQLYSHAQILFCATAMIRTLNAENPSALEALN